MEKKVQFYQFYKLDSNLELSSFFGAASTRPSTEGFDQSELIEVPKIRGRNKAQTMSSVRVEDDFIVSDHEVEQEYMQALAQQLESRRGQASNESESADLDASKLYEIIFPEAKENERRQEIPEPCPTLEPCIKDMIDKIDEFQRAEMVCTHTALDLVASPAFIGHIDAASARLIELPAHFTQPQDADAGLSVKISNVNPDVAAALSTADTEAISSLAGRYDALIRHWVSNLPAHISAHARLTKARLIRQIATELHLSSTIISVEDSRAALPRSDGGLLRSSRSSSRASVSRSSINSQSGSEPPFSDASEGTSYPTEDPSITRIRRYVSIASAPPLDPARAEILAHWPSTPGSDPGTYSWSTTRRALAELRDSDSDGEGGTARRKAARKRQKRALGLGSQAVGVNSTQPAPRTGEPLMLPLRSADSASTQEAHGPPGRDVHSVTMSQPVRGAFGGRLGRRAGRNTGRTRTKGF
jgi:hypothetical protein